MSQASANREKQHRNLIPWKKGQSGNPKGRIAGSRHKLTEDFFRDLSDSWTTFGKPALMAMAWTQPAEYVRAIASLMPKDVDVTVSHIRAQTMSDDELAAIAKRSSADPLDATQDKAGVFTVGEKPEL